MQAGVTQRIPYLPLHNGSQCYHRRMLHDLALFASLNDEYQRKPLVPELRSYSTQEVAERARREAAQLDSQFGLRNKRVLEIGCAEASIAARLASDCGCEVVAVDISPALQHCWDSLCDIGNLHTQVLDISTQDTSSLGRFDFIFSNGVLEHVRDPRAMLSVAEHLLVPGGAMHVNMGFQRSAIGSHLYRYVFFPWPHLLFTADTFRRYFISQGREPRCPEWVNGWTPEQYLALFADLGLAITNHHRLTRPLDEAFFRRFEEQLGLYPKADLETDMLYVDLEKPSQGHPQPQFDFLNAASAKHAWQERQHLFIAPNPRSRGPVVARSSDPFRAIDTLSFAVRNEHPASPPIRVVVRVVEADGGLETVVLDRIVAASERFAYSCRLRASSPQFVEFRAELMGEESDYAWLHFEAIELVAEV